MSIIPVPFRTSECPSELVVLTLFFPCNTSCVCVTLRTGLYVDVTAVLSLTGVQEEETSSSHLRAKRDKRKKRNKRKRGTQLSDVTTHRCETQLQQREEGTPEISHDHHHHHRHYHHLSPGNCNSSLTAFWVFLSNCILLFKLIGMQFVYIRIGEVVVIVLVCCTVRTQRFLFFFFFPLKSPSLFCN